MNKKQVNNPIKNPKMSSIFVIFCSLILLVIIFNKTINKVINNDINIVNNRINRANT